MCIRDRSCENGTCTIDCDETSECEGSQVVCPIGWPCLVRCTTTSACDGAVVTCPDLYPCHVECSGTSACEDLELGCSVAGTCSIACDPVDTSVCDDATVDCGGDSCIAQCAENEPAVECGPACECQGCP